MVLFVLLLLLYCKKAVKNDLDMKYKLQNMNELEVEIEDLRKSNHDLKRENSELSQKLEYLQMIAPSTLDNEEILTPIGGHLPRALFLETRATLMILLSIPRWLTKPTILAKQDFNKLMRLLRGKAGHRRSRGTPLEQTTSVEDNVGTLVS
ncbi:unnamed protein product [Fraxinus pennsylvanica]|uniref:Uncharacterized protein n=1 Tax=Fraxinus pennsylvanica TaxID=56036 RepID=A0AAD1YUP3_9LAMI|nr:unnamed protein product [Fraxinus pennsylvanica]